LSQVESGISHDDQSRLVMFTHGLIIPEGYIETASLALSSDSNFYHRMATMPSR